MAALKMKEEDRRTKVCWSYKGPTGENENERVFLILSDSNDSMNMARKKNVGFVSEWVGLFSYP